MKRNNIFKLLGFMAILLIGFTSCEKAVDVDPIGDGGQTVVKLVNGGAPGHILLGIDFVTTPQSVDVADIRRDVPNTAEMNRTMNIVVKDDTAALAQYNIDNGTDIQLMDPTWYTLNVPKSGLGGTYNITLAPGELAKQITVTIPNATLLDPAATYGFPFTIISADASGKISASKTMVFEIGAKNDYDGQYEITGTLVDANGLYTGDYGDPAFPRIYNLVTVGGLTGLFYDVSWDYANYIVVSIAAGTGANTGIRPRITFDPVTNEVVSIINHANGAVITVLPGSKFNPNDHSIDLNWNLGRWTVNEHWEYLGPR